MGVVWCHLCGRENGGASAKDKKQASRTEQFRGISLVSVVYKAMCLIIPGKVCECGRRKAIIGGGARWLYIGGEENVKIRFRL